MKTPFKAFKSMNKNVGQLEESQYLLFYNIYYVTCVNPKLILIGQN